MMAASFASLIEVCIFVLLVYNDVIGPTLHSLVLFVSGKSTEICSTSAKRTNFYSYNEPIFKIMMTVM